jgi:hypothetical protein
LPNFPVLQGIAAIRSASSVVVEVRIEARIGLYAVVEGEKTVNFTRAERGEFNDGEGCGVS